MKLKYNTPFLCFVVFLVTINFIQPASSQNSKLFSDDHLLQVKITTNLDSIIESINKESKKQKADFSYKDEEGDWIEIPITLKLRGNFRKKNCDFPPLQLNFSKSGMDNQLFSDQKKIKMVTTCTEKEFLLKEYLVYKSYNLLTDKSFRVRLLKVKFINTGKKQKNINAYSFLIEDIDEVAKRCKAKEFEPKNPQKKPEKSQFYNNLFMFHYMVGNSDFLFSSNHNLKIIRLKESKEKIIVPYDFDWCGFVDPDYKNRIQGGILTIDLKTRAYRGYCLDTEELNQTINIFNQLKTRFFDLYSGFSYLSNKEREELKNYIGEFYDFINNSQEVDIWMKEYCKIEN